MPRGQRCASPPVRPHPVSATAELLSHCEHSATHCQVFFSCGVHVRHLTIQTSIKSTQKWLEPKLREEIGKQYPGDTRPCLYVPRRNTRTPMYRQPKENGRRYQQVERSTWAPIRGSVPHEVGRRTLPYLPSYAALVGRKLSM